jgi:hypothetical protein
MKGVIVSMSHSPGWVLIMSLSFLLDIAENVFEEVYVTIAWVVTIARNTLCRPLYGADRRHDDMDN